MESAPTHRQHPLMLAMPFVLFALVSVTVGVLAQHTTAIQAGIVCTQTSLYVSTCTQTPFLHLFFSDPLHFKIWLATIAFVLGIMQLVTAGRIYGRFPLPGSINLWQTIHPWMGRLAIALTLPIAYHCIFLLGFQTFNTRVLLHSLFGSAFYGAFLGKVWIIRVKGFPGWALPIAGGILFALLLGLWLTSALWIFSQHGLSL